ncbi:MAG: copper resistance protein CopC [Microlunatus sp.]|nr:copper resistance protein CopC [Microlunatus sp.]
MTHRSQRRGRLPRWGLITVLVGLMSALAAGPAWAHNALISTSPGDGTTVSKPPSSVVLTFNEPAIATGTRLLVSGPTGSVAVGDPKLVDNTVQQDLAPDLVAGQYTVEWRVTSTDGHPINGSFSFTVRTGTVEESANPTNSPRAETPSAVPTPRVVTPPAAQPEPDSDRLSAWWWLFAVIPVGLAALLIWRFNRGPRPS